MKKKIYLDNAATTRLDDEVLDAMLPFFTEDYGNASSIHAFGLAAKAALETARRDFAGFLEARNDEIFFTGSGTESNNMLILGLAARFAEPGHIVTARFEHPSILNTCNFLEQRGWRISYVPIPDNGIIQPEDVAAEIQDDTRLITFMFANNEIGTIQNISEIGHLAASRKIHFHTDAVQAFGKTAVKTSDGPFDSLTLAGHKIHGPKGVSVLFMKRSVKLEKTCFGGGQERKLRPGTENLPAIVGFAKAAEVALRDTVKIEEHLKMLQDRFCHRIETEIDGAVYNGAKRHSLSNIANYSFPGKDSQALVMGLNLKGISVSSGSACSAGNVEPSKVLKAMNKPTRISTSALRFSWSKFTTVAEIDTTVDTLKELLGS